jgi:hypothetical protein
MANLLGYLFTQSSPSTTWIINHNLNTTPAVDVMINENSQLQKMIPLSITINNLNQITIEFSTPRSGVARLI